MTQHHSPEFLAYADRTKAAAGDPDFKKKRERVVKLLRREMHEVLDLLGYVRDGLIWVKTSPHAVTRVSIFRSRGGYQARISLCAEKTGFLLDAAMAGLALKIGRMFNKDLPSAPKSRQKVLRLQPFYRFDEHKHHPEKGTLEYALIDADNDELDLPIEVLAGRALPWLEKWHRRGAAPAVPSGYWKG